MKVTHFQAETLRTAHNSSSLFPASAIKETQGWSLPQSGSWIEGNIAQNTPSQSMMDMEHEQKINFCCFKPLKSGSCYIA